MLRTFETHEVRSTRVLSSKLWQFTPENSDKSMPVFIPSCWETYPGYENYRGKAVYETTITGEGNVKLEFKGVSHHAEVFVNNVNVGSHYGSYLPFSVYVKNLKKGSHSLKVVVDNSFSEEYSLDIPNDYYSYGGISRGVLLSQVPDAHILWTHVTPLSCKNNIWTAKVEVTAKNISSQPVTADLNINIAEKEIVRNSINIQPGEDIIFSEIIEFENVRPWSMEEPNLYYVKTKLIENEKVTDDLIDRFGFRLVTVEGTKILLNGKAIRIKGFCRHEDHPQFGCAIPPEAIAADLNLIRDMGANSVRTVHYPSDEIMLDLCDEMGLLVWEENHGRALQDTDMRNPNFRKQCEDVNYNMIKNHYNHPSIYIWGILNECGSDTEYGRSCYKEQFEQIKSLDQSRPHTYAACKRDTDICQDLPDVNSWNIYPYWYEDLDTATNRLLFLQDLILKQTGKQKPLIISEVGAGGIYGWRPTTKDKWSEDRQAEIVGKQLREIIAFEDCLGVYVWQFCDVRVDESWAMTRPRTRNNKGIVDDYRRPKLSYQVVKEIFKGISDYFE